MFEELIAHGNDMIRRLERDIGLSYAEKDKRPAHQRVPMKEWTTWCESVDKRIRTSFGSDTIARYNLIWKLFHDEEKEIPQGRSDETVCAVNAAQRIVALLIELQKRLDINQQALVGSPQSVSRTPALPNPEIVAPEYDVFISHASEDKDGIARPLFRALTDAGITVWFDEAVLEIGDSLRRKIDEGLARCRYGIVILSPRFLAKEWPQRELDGLVARETESGKKALLPVWHELDRSMLLRHSPPLADRLAGRSEEGLPALVEKILRVLRT